LFFKNTNYKEEKEKACPHVARVPLVVSSVVLVVVVLNNIQMEKTCCAEFTSVFGWHVLKAKLDLGELPARALHLQEGLFCRRQRKVRYLPYLGSSISHFST
jgi:hypothetical protein